MFISAKNPADLEFFFMLIKDIPYTGAKSHGEHTGLESRRSGQIRALLHTRPSVKKSPTTTFLISKQRQFNDSISSAYFNSEILLFSVAGPMKCRLEPNQGLLTVLLQRKKGLY